MAAARIGKVTWKNVVPIRRDVTVSETGSRRADFMEHIAHSYDTYLRDFDQEPDAMVTIFGGLKQTARSCWAIRGDSQGGATSMLALAHATLSRDLYG